MKMQILVILACFWPVKATVSVPKLLMGTFDLGLTGFNEIEKNSE